MPMVVRIVGHERGRGGRAARGGAVRDGGSARRGGREGRRGVAGSGRVSILDRPRDAARRPGHHRPRGRVPQPGDARLRHPDRRRRDARQGRPDRARRHACRSSTRSPRPSARPAPNTSCIFVPAAGAPDAVMEAAAAGIATIFCITEGIPALDMIPVVEVVRRGRRPPDRPELPRRARRPARPRSGSSRARSTARAGSASCRRSGTLTYEAVQAMTDAGHRPVDLRRDRRRPDHRDDRSSTSSSSSPPTPRPTRSC